MNEVLNTERLKSIKLKENCDNLKRMNELKLEEMKLQFNNALESVNNSQSQCENLETKFAKDKERMQRMIDQQKQV